MVREKGEGVHLKVKSLSRVRLVATLWSIAHTGSSVHGIFQARILEWVAISSNKDRYIVQHRKI